MKHNTSIDIQPNRFKSYDTATRKGRRRQNYLDYLHIRTKKKKAFERENEEIAKKNRMKKAIQRKV